MSEEQRQKAAYRALEELLEPEPRMLQHVWATAQPLSGEEFEQVAEERALSGNCGSPLCMNELLRAGGGKLRRKLYHSTYCSTACEHAVTELVRGLGPTEAARRRFGKARSTLQAMAQQQQQQAGLRPGFLGPTPQPSAAGGQQQQRMQAGGAAAADARKRGKEPAAGARGVGGVTVMSGTVQERVPAAHVPEPAAQDAAMADVLERLADAAAQPSQPPQQKQPRSSRVTFADDVRGADGQAPPSQQPHPTFSVVPSPATAGRGSSGGVPQPPVLVLDMEAAPPGNGEAGTLGFGRLQVREASEMAAGAGPMVHDGSALNSVPPVPRRDPVLSNVQERPPLSDTVAERPLRDSEVERPVSDSVVERPITETVTERPLIGSVVDRPIGGSGSGSGHADAATAPGGGSRGRRFVGRRAAADERLNAEMAEIDARLEAEAAELSGSDAGEARAREHDGGETGGGSDAESQDSELSAFDSLNMARALDVEDDDEDVEAPGTMPQPFSRLSKFGQLYTALDGWVTREALDYIQGEALERQPMDLEATQRCAVFSRQLLGALPRMSRALSLATPRSALDSPLQELATTLDFNEPLASLQAHAWEVAVLVMLKALSLRRVPALRPGLESREGVQALAAALGARGISAELFTCLVEVLCPEDI